MSSSQLSRAEEELAYALQRAEKHQPAERLDFGSWAAGYVAGFARALMILAPGLWEKHRGELSGKYTGF